MGSSISRWGNSLAVRLPRAALEAANLHEGDAVTVTAHDDALVVRRALGIDISAMIASIEPANLPDVPADSAPVGRELL
jgi:antitoxin MazE